MTSKFHICRADKGIPKSPLHHLLKSNIAPSDLEVIAVRALITVAEVRIRELQSHTPSHASQATQTQLLEFIQAHKAILSPVRCIPSEIVQEIFLHYYARTRSQLSESPLSVVPWCLGQISHCWREIALSLPSLWDEIPGIDISNGSHTKPSRLRALTYLMQRSGASPTLKFYISHQTTLKIIGYPILKKIMVHSERISSLNIRAFNPDITLPAFEGLRGRISNLRVLTLNFSSKYGSSDSLDLSHGIFKTAPALRKVTLSGYWAGRTEILQLPWSQITHFVDMLACNGTTAASVPLSYLPSLTNLYINKELFSWIASTFPHKPVTLPRLCYFKLLDPHCRVATGVFLESLTIPSVETIKISYLGLLVPRLTSMLSRSHKPSCLHTLTFRTRPLQRGEFSSLLNLTPNLIRLDIDVPPVYDILKLIDREAILVPMLQALCMHHCASVSSTQAGLFNRLAQVRCESGGILDGLHIVFDSAENRDSSQIMLNNWSPSTSPEETEAVQILIDWRGQLHSGLFKNDAFILNHKHKNYYLEMLDRFFTCIEQCKAITVNVLRVGYFSCNMTVHVEFYAYPFRQETHMHIDLHRIVVRNQLMIPGQDNLKQRAMNILDEWEQLLSNSLDDYCWARTSPQHLDNYSLVYIPEHKRQGEYYLRVSYLVYSAMNIYRYSEYHIRFEAL